MTDPAQTIAELRKLLDEYDQIVAALPKTRDGVPAWAGKTVYTIAGKPEIFTWASIHNAKDCYSTPEAARAARQQAIAAGHATYRQVDGQPRFEWLPSRTSTEKGTSDE